MIKIVANIFLPQQFTTWLSEFSELAKKLRKQPKLFPCAQIRELLLLQIICSVRQCIHDIIKMLDCHAMKMFFTAWLSPRRAPPRKITYIMLTPALWSTFVSLMTLKILMVIMFNVLGQKLGANFWFQKLVRNF